MRFWSRNILMGLLFGERGGILTATDLTGWPLMSHEYRGTTCLQSNVVNPESNAPPGISIHCFLTGLSLPGGGPKAHHHHLSWFGFKRPAIAWKPLWAQKKTHFLCRAIKKQLSLGSIQEDHCFSLQCGLFLTHSHVVEITFWFCPYLFVCFQASSH